MPIPYPSPPASGDVQPIARLPAPAVTAEVHSTQQDPPDYRQLNREANRRINERRRLNSSTTSVVSRFFASGHVAIQRASTPLPSLAGFTFGAFSASSRSSNGTILGGNRVHQRPKPYATLWAWTPDLFWSEGLVNNGLFNYTDGALLLFMVDCAMRLYIVGDLEIDFEGGPGSTKLTFTILEEVRELLQKGDLCPERLSVVQKKLPSAMMGFLNELLPHLPRIQERCDITIEQPLQHPHFKIVMARTLMDEERFESRRPAIMDALEWVYGEGSLEGRLDDQPKDGDGVEIRKWIFEHA